MSKLSEQLNVRIPMELLSELEDITKYESSKVPELIRSWIRDKVGEYRRDRRFEEWKRKQESRNSR
jgi:metal-responsive CopG/Arc/MetJ family transcriptional regulator